MGVGGRVVELSAFVCVCHDCGDGRLAGSGDVIGGFVVSVLTVSMLSSDRAFQSLVILELWDGVPCVSCAVRGRNCFV